jgi:transposase
MKLDGRTLTHETSETIRLMAVRRVNEGERASDVIKSYGLCRTTIYRWLRASNAGGEDALKSRRSSGPSPKLTARQTEKIREWICGKDPRQYGFDFGLWTREIVKELILKQFKKDVSITTVGRILARLDITPQKPLRRAYERDPEAIERWKEKEYPALKKRANRLGADIFFLDEAGIRSDGPLDRTGGAKGQTPVVPTSGQRQSVNAISAVNAKGAFWYSVYTGRFNAGRFVEFLRAFMRTRPRRVFLVVDGHPAHRAKMINKYIESTNGKLELHFLPGYAPELNPDEFVWGNLRAKGTSKKPLKKNESLRKRVENDLASIKKDKSLVRAFFGAPSVAYTVNC